VERQVNSLDRSVLDALYEGRGDQPFDPVPLLKVVLYEYLAGQQSPARWLRNARDHDPVKWLARGYVPSRTAWYNFRDRASKFIEEIHIQIVQRAIDANLVDPSIGIQDGTSTAACASRHRMINRPTLDKRIEQLDAAIAGTSTEELPKWIPPTPSGKNELRERLEIASEVLDQRITANANKPSSKRKVPNKIVVSISDPDAPLGRDKMKVYRPMYTVQLMVTTTSFILSYLCEASSTDAGTLAPMIDKSKAIVGDRLKTVLADGGYLSILDLKACHERNVQLVAPSDSTPSTSSENQTDIKKTTREDFVWDAEHNLYRCPEGKILKYVDRERKKRRSDQIIWQSRYRTKADDCQGCPLLIGCLKKGATSKTLKRLEGQELIDDHREKMATPEMQELYKLRGQTVELAFADAKGHRRMTQFHGRRHWRVKAETGLLVVAQNLMRLDALERNRTNHSDSTT
jgi:transposase